MKLRLQPSEDQVPLGRRKEMFAGIVMSQDIAVTTAPAGEIEMSRKVVVKEGGILLVKRSSLMELHLLNGVEVDNLIVSRD